jgi:hypothetical protein
MSRFEERRQAAMDVLGALLLALGVALPTALWWFQIL